MVCWHHFLEEKKHLGMMKKAGWSCDPERIAVDWWSSTLGVDHPSVHKGAIYVYDIYIWLYIYDIYMIYIYDIYILIYIYVWYIYIHYESLLCISIEHHDTEKHVQHFLWAPGFCLRTSHVRSTKLHLSAGSGTYIGTLPQQEWLLYLVIW